MDDIVRRIGNATVGRRGNSVLIGNGSWVELNSSLPAVNRIVKEGVRKAHLVIHVRGRELICVLDRGLHPYEIRMSDIII